MDRYDGGYLAVWRKIRRHWLWNDGKEFTRFEAWIDLCLDAQYEVEDMTVFMEGFNRTMICHYRELFVSYPELAERWKWDRSKVRRFITKLEDDRMIDRKLDGKLHRVTICNYDSYDPKILYNDRKLTDGTAKSWPKGDRLANIIGIIFKKFKNLKTTTTTNGASAPVDDVDERVRNIRLIFKTHVYPDPHRFSFDQAKPYLDLFEEMGTNVFTALLIDVEANGRTITPGKLRKEYNKRFGKKDKPKRRIEYRGNTAYVIG